MAKVLGTTGQNAYKVDREIYCAVCHKAITIGGQSQPVRVERKRDKAIYYADAHLDCVPIIQ